MSQNPSVDDLVNIKEANSETVGKYSDKLNSMLQLFNGMKSEVIQFENCLALLSETIGMEGELTESTLASYNTQLCGFFDKLRLLQCMKVPSKNGIAAKLIADWTTSNKSTTHQLSFMDTQYRWYRCKEMCPVDNMKVCADCDPCAAAAEYPINIGCSEVSLASVSGVATAFTANALYKLDAACKRVCVNATATYSGTDPQDKAANAPAADFTFSVLDSAGNTQTVTFSDPSPAVDYDTAFGTPTVDGAVTGSITFPVSVASGDLCDVDGNAVTSVTFNLSANYTAANVGTELDTVTVTGATLSTKVAGYADPISFGLYICQDVPELLHLILSHLDKNVIVIGKCIDCVNKLVDQYDLL